jgi:hypothetical protein
MSEKLPHNLAERHEREDENILSESKEQGKKSHENLKEHTEKSPDEIEQIAHKVQEAAKSTEQLLRDTQKEHDEKDDEPVIINHELKEIAYQRVLKRARRHLSPYSRTMSKVMHQPAIDTASEALGKTVGRPSGLIGGGLVAFLGTSAYYYISKHYGYSYNSFIFLALMAIGFVSGWLIEIIYKLLKRTK